MEMLLPALLRADNPQFYFILRIHYQIFQYFLRNLQSHVCKEQSNAYIKSIPFNVTL